MKDRNVMIAILFLIFGVISLMLVTTFIIVDGRRRTDSLKEDVLEIKNVLRLQGEVLYEHEDSLKIIKICNPYCGY